MNTSHNFPLSRAMLLGLLLCLLGVSALAQETRGTILGTIRDTAGAVVPGATVEVINTDTNIAAAHAEAAHVRQVELQQLRPGRPRRLDV